MKGILSNNPGIVAEMENTKLAEIQNDPETFQMSVSSIWFYIVGWLGKTDN